MRHSVRTTIAASFLSACIGCAAQTTNTHSDYATTASATARAQSWTMAFTDLEPRNNAAGVRCTIKSTKGTEYSSEAYIPRIHDPAVVRYVTGKQTLAKIKNAPTGSAVPSAYDIERFEQQLQDLNKSVTIPSP